MEKKTTKTKKTTKSTTEKRVSTVKRATVKKTPADKDALIELVIPPAITQPVSAENNEVPLASSEPLIIPTEPSIIPEIIAEEISSTELTLPNSEESTLEAIQSENSEVEETTPRETLTRDEHLIPSIVATIVFLLITLLIWYFYKGDKKPILVYTANETAQQAPSQADVVPEPVKVKVENITLSDPKIPVGNTKENITTTGPKIFKEPGTFNSFSYDASVGKQVILSGICHDEYYALIIFDAKDDYRKSAGKAVSNRAFTCGANKKFTVDMNLKDLNLSNGTYYVFVADQGKTGSWYNPR